ncbi:MAG: hypothetical protein M1818_007009 [Claussenomyces sp. TS43310]|nr:MAG: hypothetical protein M1818_007009 [Claussenomyces sp. TS43310]
MAQKAKKDRARTNNATLNNTHIIALVSNFIFLLSSLLYFHRSLLAWAILSIPSFVCQYILETTGRPKYNPNGSLRSSGEDLSAEGLTEYMFDVIWVTWACLVTVLVFGNWGWSLWAAVPVFGLYKGYGMLGAARGMMSGANPAMAQGMEQPPAAAGNRRSRRTAA